ncbi:MAG: ABC transporter substrate-binding protein [Aggregatilineales bacterium]
MPAARRSFIAICALLSLAGCARAPSNTPTRIALLAPFEGRYREIGYNALYAAQLALQDVGDHTFELLPVDDGGSVASAGNRARALALDPAVRAVVVLGYAATDPDTLRSYSNLPVLVVGYWDAQPQPPNVFVLASAALEDTLTTPRRVPVTTAARLPGPLLGGDVLALAQFPRLRVDLNSVLIVSSGSLPTPEFTARYLSNSPFAPTPGLLASLTYDAVRLAALAAAEPSRAAAASRLAAVCHQGLNGSISFDENGWWRGAPINHYQFDDRGRLVPADRVVE